MKDEPPKEGEVLPPEEGGDGNMHGSVNVDATIIQLIKQYTDRPDLLIDALERHDKGFVKRMTSSAQQFAENHRNKRLLFSEIQSYVALAIVAIASLALICILFYSIYRGNEKFFTIIGLIFFYAVIQSGPSGFAGIAKSMARLADTKRNSYVPIL